MNGATGRVIEILWPLFHREQLHEYDIPSVRMEFGNDGIHVINPISKQFTAK